MSTFKLVNSYTQKPSIPIGNEEQLRAALGQVSNNENCIVSLESSGHGTLTVGLGKNVGFVQFVNAAQEPPYMLAREDQSDNPDFVEFNAGGTPTPIPARYCMDVGKVVDIVIFFFENKKLPEHIRWESI